MYKPDRKPWPKSKTSDISKQSPSPLHRTFLLGRARFTAQPLSALFAGGYPRLVPQKLNGRPLLEEDLLCVYSSEVEIGFWSRRL